MPYETRRRKSISNRTKIVALSCLALAALLVAAAAFTSHQELLAKNAAEAGNYTPAPITRSTTEPPATVDDAMARLTDTTKPWTLGVLGDSTGNSPDEWVHLVVTELAAKHDRPAIIHNWSIESNSYENETRIGSGDGEPIIVWNGSASGMGAGYSLDHFGAKLPEPADLVIISHGHNVPSEAAPGAASLRSAALRLSSETAVAITLQNPRADESNEPVVEALRETWGDHETVTLIDVHEAFNEAGNLDSLLLDDGLHPSVDGSKLWAQTVNAALGV